ARAWSAWTSCWAAAGGTLVGRRRRRDLESVTITDRRLTRQGLQGGDPEGTGRGGPGYRFADELPKPGRYELGSVAMANAGPDTNGSQFFIISGPQGAALPPQYSLFGKVVAGLDVVAAIDAVGTGSGKPRERVTIESVTIAES
ncbi:MAG TPA: peptidylprolyl isomerase, partial [Acidimicrobiales bacterium]|nr:peptidylprolyl isomerase [Acidimicrobiales bacterium]